MQCCFGPYSISSNSLPENLVDNQKTRQIVVITPCDDPVTPPCDNAIILHQIDCSSNSCNITWYECPSVFGRQYTVISNPCGISVTSFENGFLSDGACDGSLIGSDDFCFGQISSSEGIFKTDNACKAVFEFDGHTFTVEGSPGECGELYNCECHESQTVTTFGQPLPESPTLPIQEVAEDESIIVTETVTVAPELRTVWHNLPVEDVGVDTVCDSEVGINDWEGGVDLKDCESEANPSVARLPSGQTVIAFEKRNNNGQTKIALSILPTSVKDEIIYHRDLGRGTLINAVIDGIVTFIVFDDFSLENTIGIKLGFLMGVLKGNLVDILSHERTIENGRIRNTFTFVAPQGLSFPDSNHIYDIAWFLLNINGPSLDYFTTTLLDLPFHTQNNEIVPVAYPSVSTGTNNLSPTTEQNFYVAYQAFESGPARPTSGTASAAILNNPKEWRAYIRHIIIGGDTTISPAYLFPYSETPVAVKDFSDPYIVLDDPYILSSSTNYKPDDLWTIKTGDSNHVTRVLYNLEQENISFATSKIQAGNNDIDFMFLIDHSQGMQTTIDSIKSSIFKLSETIIDKGLDARFGFVAFGRRNSIFQPTNSVECSCQIDNNPQIFNGLQDAPAGEGCTQTGITGGFTDTYIQLQQALNCWGAGTSVSYTSPWAAVQFAIERNDISWRTNANKVIFFVTDTDDDECAGNLENPANPECPPFTNFKEDAKSSISEFGAIFIPSVNPIHFSTYQDVARDSGWIGEIFDVNSLDYGSIFESVIETLTTDVVAPNTTVIEKAGDGDNSNFLKRAEVIITYDGDLSDKWTNDKSDFNFTDILVINDSSTSKGLTKLPFTLGTNEIYGINNVHIKGNSQLWVTFPGAGNLFYDSPAFGKLATSVSDPLLIALNSTRPKVKVNHRNDVFVAYQTYTNSVPEIHIIGTGDFHQNSITGPKAERTIRLLEATDFAFSHSITLPGEGVNQLCDFVVDKNDITHVVWQSNRDDFWEIYYANSFDLFQPIRVTKFESFSGYPSIDIDDDGSIFVVYHDNRFGPFEIMMAFKDENRVMPLLEQDAYLASLQNNYSHYTNSVPIFVDNPKDDAFFHIIVEFYRNFNLEGDAEVIVDSRDNLDAFINALELEDPYGFVSTKLEPRGLFLKQNTKGVVFFDATLVSPGSPGLSKPYGFIPNQAYFLKVFLVNTSTDEVRESGLEQSNTFSCTQCSVLGDNNFDTSGCSYSFTVTNDALVDKFYNFQVDFYADSSKQHIVKRFNLSANNDDLQFAEVDNKAALDEWSATGLLIKASDKVLVQVYPSLDTQSGFLCGIIYTVQVNQCNHNEIECIQFLIVDGLEAKEFLCECSSQIFTNPLVNLAEISRWQSSAQGYADTRVTDSPKESIRSVIKTRSTGAAIITWEDHNSSPSRIKAATFRDSDQDQLRSSGSRSWFDYDFEIEGEDPSVTVDLFDRVSTCYEKPSPPDPVTGFFGKGVSANELQESSVHCKICDFKEEGQSISTQVSGTDIDISNLESNVIVSDAFISKKIVRQILIKRTDVEYYTYNASGKLTPVVSACDLKLHIHGTPEIIAVRFRNEDDINFSTWEPWSPEISDFVMEKKWRISGGSGIKQVCIQAITYSGITTEFCIPIVADYRKIVFESRFYNDSVIPEDFVKLTDENFTLDDNKLVLLPLSSGVSIANLSPKNDTFPTERDILVEIIPRDEDATELSINFDVIQQGANDQFGLLAVRGKNNDGKVMYRGFFKIQKEDKVSNIDGLARISPIFPVSCEEFISTTTVVSPYEKDPLNIVADAQEVSVTSPLDALSDFRQEISGRVGVTVDIRPTEDPYFIFGDPNYAVIQKDGERKGVPFKVEDSVSSDVPPPPEDDGETPPPPPPGGEGGGDEGDAPPGG